MLNAQKTMNLRFCRKFTSFSLVRAAVVRDSQSCLIIFNRGTPTHHRTFSLSFKALQILQRASKKSQDPAANFLNKRKQPATISIKSRAVHHR